MEWSRAEQRNGRAHWEGRREAVFLFASRRPLLALSGHRFLRLHMSAFDPKRTSARKLIDQGERGFAHTDYGMALANEGSGNDIESNGNHDAGEGH